jgi:hypothetical protein
VPTAGGGAGTGAAVPAPAITVRASFIEGGGGGGAGAGAEGGAGAAGARSLIVSAYPAIVIMSRGPMLTGERGSTSRPLIAEPFALPRSRNTGPAGPAVSDAW